MDEFKISNRAFIPSETRDYLAAAVSLVGTEEVVVCPLQRTRERKDM
jgi:hypothetical protein